MSVQSSTIFIESTDVLTDEWVFQMNATLFRNTQAYSSFSTKEIFCKVIKSTDARWVLLKSVVKIVDG